MQSTSDNIGNAEQANSILNAIKSIAHLEFSSESISNNGSPSDSIAGLINSLSKQIENLVAEHQQVQKNLTEQVELLKKTQEVSHFGSWMLDIKTNKLVWSDEVYNIFGLKPQEFEATYDAFLNAVHPDDREKVNNAYLNSIKNGHDSYEIEHRLVRGENGQTRYVLEKCIHERDSSGIIVRSIGFVHDITERKKTEESLIESIKEASDYKYGLDSSSIVAITDEKGIIKYANENFCTISGYNRSELIGQDHRILNSGYHPREFMRVLWKTISSGKLWKGEVRNKAKNDSYYWVDTTIVPFMNDKGNPFQYLAIRHDITKRKESEENLNRLNAELENLVKERTRESENSKKYYKALIENSSDGILLINIKGIIVYQSPTVSKISGFGQGELIGIQAVEVIHSDDIPDYNSLLKKIMGEPGEPLTKQYRMKNKKREYIWVEGTVSNQLKDETIKGFIVNYRDITERKVSELKILDSEARLNKAQAIAHLGSWEHNLVNNTVYWSDEVYRIFEIKNDNKEASYNAYTELVHPDDRARVRYIYQESLVNKNKFTNDYRLLLPDGKIKYVQEQCETSFDENDEPLKSFGTILDITERKEAELAVFRSEAQLKKAQEIGNIGSWDLNFATGVAIWSDEACRIYGIPVKQNKQTFEQWLSFIHPDDLNYVMSVIDESQKTFSDSSMEHRIVLKNGTIKHVRSISKFQFDQNGKPTGLFGISHDITEIKKGEQLLNESELKYKSLFENMLDGVYKSSPEGKFLDVNPAMVKMLGYKSKKDLMAVNINKDLYIDEADRAKARKQEETGQVAVIQLKKKDGTRIWAEDRGHYVLDENGNLLYNEGVLRDVTEKVRAEQERTRVAADLVHKNKDLEQFAYIVSHNLRAPVANIIGLTNILVTPDIPAELQAESKNGLLASALKLDGVIKDLNTILQVRGELIEKREKVVLSKVIASISDSISSIIKNSGAVITTDFTALDEINTVKSYIYSIFYNLILNSIKFQKVNVKPAIKIRSGLQDDKIVIKYTDNGIGFDLNRDRENVFGLYKRFNLQYEGKGVGLYMVKMQVELLGGTIALHSELGKGAEFIIEFDNIL